MAQPVEQENVSYNSPDGALYGRTSTKRIGFYGATPIVRTITASTTDVGAATTVSINMAGTALTSWGFSSQAQINNIITAVSTMQYAMKQLGIIS